MIKTDTLVRMIAWYAAHVALLAMAFVAVAPLRAPVAAVVVVTLLAVAVLGWWQAKRAHRRVPVYYAMAVAGSGVSLSALLLLIDWAVGMGDRQLTPRSFLSYLMSAFMSATAPTVAIVVGPCALLLIAAAAGAYFGSLGSDRSNKVAA